MIVSNELETVWKVAAMILFKVLSRYFPGRAEKNRDKSHCSQSVGRNLKLGPPVYETD
jgi:hypothetical protein